LCAGADLWTRLEPGKGAGSETGRTAGKATTPRLDASGSPGRGSYPVPAPGNTAGCRW